MSAWEAQVSDPSWCLITATTLCPQLLALLLRLCGQPLRLHSVHKVECEGEGAGGGRWAQHLAGYLPRTSLICPKAPTQDPKPCQYLLSDRKIAEGSGEGTGPLSIGGGAIP